MSHDPFSSHGHVPFFLPSLPQNIAPASFTMTRLQSLFLFQLVFLTNQAASFVPTATIRQRHRQNADTGKNGIARNMFTGIVEEMGTVVSLEERDDMLLWDGSKGSGTELSIKSNVMMEGAYLGCSICVSGVCLTATELEMDKNIFKVGLAPETLRRTYLGGLVAGDAVNLERASEIGGRNSGHFVQGHVDGTGDIIDRWQDEDSLFFKVRVTPDMLKYIVPKGFIAIDGASLTVCEVDYTERFFTFMLVGFTQKKIVIPAKLVGEKVNIEVDVLGKYSENALAALVPRLEALEAKVESLARELAATKL
jgi:riboflavin synthase